MGKMSVWALALLFLCFMMAGGCSKLNKENYDKLKIGMEYEEVVDILGNADECSSALNAKNCIWGNDKKNITINFVAGKAVFFTGKGL